MVGLEKVSPVGEESVSVKTVLVDGVSLVVGMLVGGGALVGAVEVVELLLSEKQVNAQSDSSASEHNANLYSPMIN